MKIQIAELPVLVPFLADETFTLTYGYWRDFHPGRDLHRVNRPVAAIINDVAKRDLARLDAFCEKDAAGKRKHLDQILQWCREHGGQSREEYLLKALAEAKTWRDFGPAAAEAVSKRIQATLPTLVKRFGTFPSVEENAGVVRLCYQMDSTDAAEPARQWLNNAEPSIRYWAALILLRHGDKDRVGALDALEPILAQDDGTHKYPGAISPLLATKDERASKLACGILKKTKFNEQPGWLAEPVLQRLLLAGRQECLDYLLAKLDSDKTHGGSSGARNGKHVEQSLVEGDDMALAVAKWRLDKSEYDTLAPDDECRTRRKQLKTWLIEQFALVKAGKEPAMKPPEKLIESSGPFLDAP